MPVDGPGGIADQPRHPSRRAIRLLAALADGASSRVRQRPSLSFGPLPPRPALAVVERLVADHRHRAVVVVHDDEAVLFAGTRRRRTTRLTAHRISPPRTVDSIEELESQPESHRGRNSVASESAALACRPPPAGAAAHRVLRRGQCRERPRHRFLSFRSASSSLTALAWFSGSALQEPGTGVCRRRRGTGEQSAVVLLRFP